MNLQYITDSYLKRYRRRFSQAWEINYSDCFRWARIAYQLHGGQLCTVTMYADQGPGEFEQQTSHAFLKLDGKYYDSEAVQGLDNWIELGYFRRIEEWWSGKLDYYFKLKEHKSFLSFRRDWKVKKHSERSDKDLLNKLQLR